MVATYVFFALVFSFLKKMDRQISLSSAFLSLSVALVLLLAMSASASASASAKGKAEPESKRQERLRKKTTFYSSTIQLLPLNFAQED